VNKQFKISVIISTYNPKLSNLQQALDGLKGQDLPLTDWECIIVDNASTNATLTEMDTNWHPHIKIVKELRQGLTFARIKGYEQSSADLLVFVDDDNILAANYLSVAIAMFKKFPDLGVAGGKSIGVFEQDAPEWLQEFYSLLAVRPQAHPQTIISGLSNGYPPVAPIGACMVISRHGFRHYYNYINKLNKRIIQDRVGTNLSSGGDNEINIIALKNGYEVGYFPDLSLKHLIGKERLEPHYLKRLNYASSRSWVKLLYAHNICPWQPIMGVSLFLRHAKAYFTYKAWKSPAHSIKFYGACGMFKGLSELN
jgi:glycosyltransferase involved in cell wall biosynthesis